MEDYGAFVEKFELRSPPPLQDSSTPPLLCLSGLTFAVKEMYGSLIPVFYSMTC